MRQLIAWFLLAALGLGGSAAMAVPAATGYVGCVQADGSSTTDAFACSGLLDGATRQLAPYAGLTAISHYPGGFTAERSGAVAFLTYYFTVIGPDTQAAIPIDIDAHLHQSTTGSGYGFSEILATAGTDIFHAPNSAYEVICSDAICLDRSNDFTGTLHLMTEVNYISSIFLEVSAQSGFNGTANSGEASADPLIYIDQSFADAARYSIVLSDGVANALPGTVPEPTTWTLLVAGFGLVGARCRRRLATGCGSIGE